MQGEKMKQGFTLIELLVVVLIIGILAAVALPQYTRAVEKSRFTQAITAIRSLRDAEQVYYMANGAYTTNLADLDVSFPQGLSYFTGLTVHTSPLNHIETYRVIDGQRVWIAAFLDKDGILVCGVAHSVPAAHAARRMCQSLSGKKEIITPSFENGYDHYSLS